ncbi:hypothetical protein G6F31_016422 [Rhizopus arrhizus]|nr:hypothetical protein G6F31_016422 [Rhizopus arrhizus]
MASRMATLEAAAWPSAAATWRELGPSTTDSMSQPSRAQPQPARQTGAGEPARRRRGHAADDDGQADRDRHHEPRVQQDARAGLANRNAAHLVQPEADDHRDDGAHLQQRQPELQFAEHLDRTQVDRADEAHDRQHPDPARHVGIPEAHVQPERGDVGQTNDDHLEGIGPARQEPGDGSQIAGGVLAERPRHGTAAPAIR